MNRVSTSARNEDRIQVNIETGIGEKDRHEIVEGLTRVLADTYILYLKTRNFHWNVTGPMFEMLHLMFERQYNELSDAVDEVAERIRALDCPAPGAYAEFSRHSSIKEETGVTDAQYMLHRLLEGHETVVRTARTAFPTAERAHDESTIDLLTERMRTHEKTAWMLRSMLRD